MLKDIFTVYGDKRGGGFGKYLTGLAFFIFIMLFVGRESQEAKPPLLSAVSGQVAKELVDAIYVQFMPAGADYAGEGNVAWLVRTQTESLMPLYGVEAEYHPEYIAKQSQQES